MAIKRLSSIEISEEEEARLNKMEEEAVRDSDAETGSAMVTIRWGRPQLRMIRKAAEARGIPYQIYVRNAAFEMARNDLERTAPSRQGDRGQGTGNRMERAPRPIP